MSYGTYDADRQTASILQMEIENMIARGLIAEHERMKTTLIHIAGNDTANNECCARAAANDHLLDHYIAAAGLALKVGK